MLWIVLTTFVAMGVAITLVLARMFKQKIKTAESDFAKSENTVAQNACLVMAGLCGFLLVLLAIVFSVYTQDPGQASVLVSFTGSVSGINYEPGMHIKAPWSSRVVYDTRNNVLSYTGAAGQVKQDYTGGDVSGPQITFQDANSVSGNIDLNVRYSINGSAVEQIYSEYKTQEEFVNSALAPEVRAKTREILSKYETAKVYNDRDGIKAELLKALRESWSNEGVEVEDLYLQEIRYPDSVVNAFADAQSARAKVEMAKADQERAKVEAETNRIKAQALDNRILTEKMIDAIRNSNGNTFVIGDEMVSIGVK